MTRSPAGFRFAGRIKSEAEISSRESGFEVYSRINPITGRGEEVRKCVFSGPGIRTARSTEPEELLVRVAD